MVDILTFAESPEYLGRKLFPAQQEILAEFYDPAKPYEELLLICGRDSTKTFMVSIIAAYTAYLWLEIPDPYYLYQGRVDRGKEVHIICLAVKSEQATILLDEIKAKINTSPYFADKIVSMNNFEIVLNKNLHIIAATSNSASEVGKTAILVLFDEIGKYGQEQGTRDGEEVYDSLTPSVGRFASNRPEFLKRCAGDAGLERIVRFLGRVVSMSTPMGKQGILWRIYQTALRMPEGIRMYHRPTWEMNPNYPIGCAYLEEQRKKNPAAFNREYGAEFDEAVDAMFPREIVDRNSRVSPPPYDYQMEYIGVLDTSKHKDAFGFAIGHLLGGRVVIDVIKYFFPDKGVLNWNHVTNEIIQICRRYRVDHLLHDGYEGEAVKLYFNNFLLTETPFSGQYKMQIYSSLEDRMYQNQIEYPAEPRLLAELKAIQKKWNGDKFTIHHPDSGPVTTDEGPDLIANLSYFLFTRFVKTREGLDDSRSSQGWPEDNNEDCIAFIAGGQVHC